MCRIGLNTLMHTIQKGWNLLLSYVRYLRYGHMRNTLLFFQTKEFHPGYVLAHKGVFRNSNSMLFSEIDILLLSLFIVYLALDITFTGAHNLWYYFSGISFLLVFIYVFLSPISRYLGVLVSGSIYLYFHIMLLVGVFLSPRYVIIVGSVSPLAKGAKVFFIVIIFFAVVILLSVKNDSFLKKIFELFGIFASIASISHFVLEPILKVIPVNINKQIEDYLSKTIILVMILKPQHLFIIFLSSILLFIPISILLYLLSNNSVEVINDKIWLVRGQTLSSFENAKVMQSWGYDYLKKISEIQGNLIEINLKSAVNTILGVIKPKKVIFYMDPTPSASKKLRLIRDAKLSSSGTLSIWIYEEELVKLIEQCSETNCNLKNTLKRKLFQELNDILFARLKIKIYSLTFIFSLLLLMGLSLYFFQQGLLTHAYLTLFFTLLILLYDKLLTDKKIRQEISSLKTNVGKLKKFFWPIMQQYIYFTLTLLIPLFLSWIGTLYINPIEEQVYVSSSVLVGIVALLILSYTVSLKIPEKM